MEMDQDEMILRSESTQPCFSAVFFLKGDNLGTSCFFTEQQNPSEKVGGGGGGAGGYS